jgi:valyl-tRNA synthetase
VPVIADDYVDVEFGTGCLKITPAHDINDYEIGIRHKLKAIDIFNDDGTMSEAAELYIGKDRFAVREEIMRDLESNGHLVKVEDYVNKVGFSERTDEVIEPKLSLQWFLKMEELAKPALDVVMDDTISFHPKKFKNTYRHWMENVRDWCISRQLWWGQRIPAYYHDGEVYVAETPEEALEQAKKATGNASLSMDALEQDEDVLDTWFSSWLWPISVFDGIRDPDNKEINYYYPTNDLVTAPEILFFWVARMIMAGLEYRREIPFKNVYLTGIVRDKQGRKMSKSLGNSPDPIGLMEKYGADGVRVGMLLTSPAGNDLPFDEALCEQGRNFSNKVWNALRLVKGWKVDDKLDQPEVSRVAIEWFTNKFNSSLVTIDDHFSKYRISDALMSVYKLIWDDFCSWFLEMVKPGYQQDIDRQTYDITIRFFEDLVKVLHPFMPFISEEIWHHLADREEPDCLMVASMPVPEKFDRAILKEFEYVREVVMGIRNVRKEKNIPNREEISLLVKKNEGEEPRTFFDPVVAKLCKLSGLDYTDTKEDGAVSFIIGKTEFYIPLEGQVDVEAEIEKLTAELKYTRGFLSSVEKKLGNERFVNNAPEQVVAKEKQKKADAEARIRVIEEQISALKG